MTGAPGVERLRRVGHDGQRLVVDVDELERVARDVLRLRDDERDLLALETHLVGRQHGLGVVGQRRHPGEAEGLEHRAGDDRLDTGERLGGGRVDRVDPRVRERAPQDGAVEHAGQLHVVDVVALAAQEADVLLAMHATEADRVAGCAEGHRSLFDGGHAVTSLVAGCSAAHWIAATMFL